MNKSTKYQILIIIILLVILIVLLKITKESIVQNNSRDILNPFDDKMSEKNENISYNAANKITEDKTINTGNFSSNVSDENAILLDGNIKVDISDIVIEKNGDSNQGDTTSFYGINSAILAKDSANLTLKNIQVVTDAIGANGVFCYGGLNGDTIVNISDSIITTKKDNSGGIMTTGGGNMNASNLIVNTSGTSSAAIRTDRGGGNVIVNGGTYSTTGKGSPAIYSTADVKVNNANLNSYVSEGIIIEGKNSVEINSCNLEDNNTELNGMSTTYKNIFLYQSMSGDADVGNAQFKSSNSNIVTNKGDTLYVTNTLATIILENNTIINNDLNGNFLRIQKDSWGNNGNNGGEVKLILNNQNVTGNIVVDSISTLDIELNENSYFEGFINKDKEAQSITIKLDSTSKIKLTADSYVSEIKNEDLSNDNIDFNGYKLYVNGNSIN